MTRLRCSIGIRAPIRAVWSTMLDKPSYEAWTRAFCEGSTYEGSWETGARVRFLTPDGRGISSVVAENRKYQRISIRHLTEIREGVDVTEEECVQRWAGAVETYEFRPDDNGTEVSIEMDAPEEYEPYLRDTWPKALAILKRLCEETPELAGRG